MAIPVPDDLRALRRLHLQLGRRVDSLFAGDYRAAVRGRGMEFDEVRAYTPGDDVRRIDWNVTARRGGEPYVKLFREERQLTLVLVVDLSGSTEVGFGAGAPGDAKRRLVARVAGALAIAAARNRDRVGVLTFSDGPETWLAPRASRHHAWAVLRAVTAGSRRSRGTALAPALERLARSQRRRCTMVVVSDFLDDGPWARPLGMLARRHEVHAVVVHDPIERGLGTGLFEIEDAETGAVRVVDGATWAGEADPAERVRAARACGCRAVAISTHDDALLVLHRHLQQAAVRR
jgi:uncharacterized protein (DUF58 family)